MSSSSRKRGERIVWKRRSTKDQIMVQIQLFDSRTQTEHKKKRKRNSKRWDLVSFEELPEYMKDNEYILNYYRAEWPLTQAFLSVFRWHNETLNVWT